MSKRRNKNKGQAAGKGGKPNKSAPPAANPESAAVATESAAGMDMPMGDLSAMLVSDEAAADEAAPADAAGQDDSGDTGASPAADGDLADASAHDAAAASDDLAGDARGDADTFGASDPEAGYGAPAWETPAAPLHEFEDASAALARAIPVDPTEAAEASSIASIQIPESTAEPVDAGAAWDAGGADAADSSAPDAGAGQVAPATSGKGRKKLKLNKLQKHTRGPVEAEAEAPEAAPAPVRAPRAPREPRIPAFAKLTEFQSLSLAHVPGVPEEADVPGHWRGVGFGIGGRRLVSAFDEVVEIMRLPQITHVPGTQPWMLGVANVRGTLLPVVDLKQFLEGERTVMHEGQRVLVVRQAGGNVAVLIDQLFGQRSFNDAQRAGEAAPSGTRYDNFIKQIYRVGDNDWGVFSMSLLTRTPEFRQAAA